MKDEDSLPYKYFNATLFAFMTDIEKVYPNDRWKIVIVRNLLRSHVSKDVKALQAAFAVSAAPYEEKMRNKDSTFFLDKNANDYKTDYKSVLAGLDNDEIIQMKENVKQKTKAGGGSFDQFVYLLKERWGLMDDDNREVIWQYCHKLLDYNKMCKNASQS
jgi:hypothetical protein